MWSVIPGGKPLLRSGKRLLKEKPTRPIWLPLLWGEFMSGVELGTSRGLADVDRSRRKLRLSVGFRGLSLLYSVRAMHLTHARREWVRELFQVPLHLLVPLSGVLVLQLELGGRIKGEERKKQNPRKKQSHEQAGNPSRGRSCSAVGRMPG